MVVASDALQPCGLQPTRLLCPWDFPGKNTGVGCHPLLQGIFLTQVWNPGLPHCRQALYWQAVYSSGLYLEVRLYHLGTPGVYPASSPCPVSRVLCPCPTTTVCTCLHSGVTPWAFPKAYYEKLQHEACLTSCTVEVLIKLWSLPFSVSCKKTQTIYLFKT